MCSKRSGKGDSLLRRVKALLDLPAEAISRLEQGATFLEVRHGADLFSQGDFADAVYAVIGGEGSIRIGVMSKASKKLMVEVFRTGDLFGEIGVIEGGTRTASAVADGRVRLAKIDGGRFLSVLRDTPALGEALTRTMAQRLRRTFALFQDATFETLDVRLARQLLYLAKLEGRQTESGMVIGGCLTQSDLADLMGATRRSVITILNRWRKAGVIKYDPGKARLTIPDLLRLRTLLASGGLESGR
jgi:CRP/FNR family transcriptional regulator, cyclic AMP receptor protein